MGKSSDAQTVGYNYFLTWAQVICRGPVDALLAVYNGEDQLWCGWLRRTSENSITGEAIETFDGESIHFYFGTDDQEVSPLLAALHETPELLSPYRGSCYAVFDDYKLGNANRAPTISFVVLRQPMPHGAFDCNLAWVLDAILRQVGATSLDIDTDAFSSAAVQLLGGSASGNNSNYSGSLVLTSYQSAMTYVEQILTHIDAQLIFSAEGKFSLQLLRDDIPVEELPTITDSDLIEDAEISGQTWQDIVNIIQVQYPHRYPFCECSELPPKLTQVACDTKIAFDMPLLRTVVDG